MDRRGGPHAPDGLTRQYSSMGFSLLTATSRMWLLRKRILPGREMLVSHVIPGETATGTRDPPLSVPSPLASQLLSWPPPLLVVKATREQSPLSGGRRHPRLRARDLSGRRGTLEAAIWSRSPCLGLMARSMPRCGHSSQVTSQIHTKDGPTQRCFVFRPIPP